MQICYQDIFLSLKEESCKIQVLLKLVMDQNLRQQANAKVPIRETNNGKKSKNCNQCNFVSSHTGDLSNHLKIHNEEKSNKCNQCEYASTYASALRTHLKTHSGEKPNKCNQCDYASTRADQLTIHTRKHVKSWGTSVINENGGSGISLQTN